MDDEPASSGGEAYVLLPCTAGSPLVRLRRLRWPLAMGRRRSHCSCTVLSRATGWWECGCEQGHTKGFGFSQGGDALPTSWLSFGPRTGSLTPRCPPRRVRCQRSVESSMGVSVKADRLKGVAQPKPHDQQKGEPKALDLKTCVGEPCGGGRKVQPRA